MTHPESEIRFVYFDLGNVLVSFDPALACANVAELFGVTPADADRAVYQSGLQNRYEHGEGSGEQYATVVREALGDSAEPVATDDVLEAISAMFTPVEQMRAVIDSVRDRGLRLGVLSNTCQAHWDWILRQSYDVMGGRFDVTILSCAVGSMKPDSVIYEAAEAAAGVPPEQILFLDDKAENVAAAVDRGWTSEQCLGGPQAQAALQKHGVIEPPAVR